MAIDKITVEYVKEIRREISKIRNVKSLIRIKRKLKDQILLRFGGLVSYKMSINRYKNDYKFSICV